MKYTVYIILLLCFCGCVKVDMPVAEQVRFDAGERPTVTDTKADDRSVCVYWRCSTTKKPYMQKYEKDARGEYKPAGAYKLGEGIGAFPISELDHGKSNSGITVSWKLERDPCPHCGNESLGRCSCSKLHCMPIVLQGQKRKATCPYCGKSEYYSTTDEDVRSGGDS